jgi:hypothetical protein
MWRHWSRRTRWGAVALTLVALVTVLNHLARPQRPDLFRNRAGVTVPGYSAKGALEQPSKSDVSQVTRLLDARAHAVIDGDEAAFLSGVDTDRRSFDQGQRVVWGNTRRLPLAQLSFAYDGIVQPDQPLHTATFVARVTTTYELSGYDTSPVQVDEGFSFLERHGTWKLADVTDDIGQSDQPGQADQLEQPDQLVQPEQKALPVPWNGGPIDTYGDGDYLAVVDRGQAALARRIVALCHRGTRADRALLGVANTRPTVVLATSHAPGFIQASGPDALAVTYPLSGPDGVTPGWRVMVNPRDVAEVAASPVVLPHELTHLATQDYLAYLPDWLAEGSAEYVGWHSQGGLPTAMRVRGYQSELSLPDELPASSTFYHHDVQLDYVEGMALVSWIVEHRGSDAVLTLMKAYADAGGYDVSFDPDAATPKILDQVLGMSPGSLARAAFAELNAAVPTT